MEPRPVQGADELSFSWAPPPRGANGNPTKVTMGPPRHHDNSDPRMTPIRSVDVLYGLNENHELVTRIPFVCTPDELIELSRGGTIWLTIWGSMPPVDLGVTDREGNAV